MTQRSRNILIIVILAILIGAGGAGIYFYSSLVPTSLTFSANSLALDGNGNTMAHTQEQLDAISGGSTIDWLGNCTYNYDPTDRSNWEASVGGSLQIPFTCAINDTTTEHNLEVYEIDLRAYVYKLPPNEACLDQNSRGQFSEWPKAPDDQGSYNWNTLQGWIANHIKADGADCSGLPAGVANIQEPSAPDRTQTLTIPAGQDTVTFTTTHIFDQCDWYQYDVHLGDPDTGAIQAIFGSFRRSYGTPAQCGVIVPSEEASLEVRAYMDDDRNDEYGPAVSEGTEFFEKKISIVDTVTGQEIDYAAEQCTGSPNGELGGVGRKVCPSLVRGRAYEVTLLDLLPETLGPIQEPHNTGGSNPVTITLAGDPTVDVVDFGFDPEVQAGKGDLVVRVYEEQDVTKDDEYSGDAEGQVFASTPVTITDASGTRVNPVSPPNPDCDAQTGGVGRIFCNNLDPGQYTIDIDPDITTHDGPDPELHNTNGEDPFVVTVTVGQRVIADFQYLPRVISPAFSCTLGAQPAQGIVPLDTTLTATVSPAGAQIQSFDWDFDDGQNASGTQNTQQHTYAQQGLFNPVVTVTAQSGLTANCTTAVQATLITPSGLTCTLEANPASGLSPLDTILTTKTGVSTSAISSYEYAFGDGSAPVTSTQATQQHTYTGKGTYTAVATITDGTGQSAKCNTPVEVDQIVQAALCDINVVDYLDLNKNLQQDPGVIGYIDPGMDGARITIQKKGDAPITKISAPIPRTINRYGEAEFKDIPCGTYNVSIDESSSVVVGGTTQSYVLNAMQRLTPPASTTQVTVVAGQSGVRVGFGYTPRSEIEAFLCDIDKTVADTSDADEGTPDDPKVSNSSPGETLTYTITWDCSGFPETGPLSQTIGFTLTDDFYDPLLTLVPGSITGGGVYNQSQGIITWDITGASNVDQGSVSFDATVASVLAPGTYVLPNYVVAVGNNGTILDQDQTVTIVTVVDNGEQVPDLEVVKYAQDVNGGEVLPGDILQYYVVVWNNGNTPLLDVTVTENIQPNVNNFQVISIPSGAVDSSTTTGGSNNTGFLNVSGIDLANRGDVATIVYQVTVNAGVPDGTQLVNLVTAAHPDDEDTDDETVVVGEVLPTPPPPPPAGPGPTNGTTVTSGDGTTTNGALAVPPLLGARAYVPPLSDAAPEPAPETGVGAVMWILLVSLMTAFGVAGYVVIRQKNRLLDS